jgi:hypothetical protein
VSAAVKSIIVSDTTPLPPTGLSTATTNIIIGQAVAELTKRFGEGFVKGKPWLEPSFGFSSKLFAHMYEYPGRGWWFYITEGGNCAITARGDGEWAGRIMCFNLAW